MDDQVTPGPGLSARIDAWLWRAPSTLTPPRAVLQRVARLLWAVGRDLAGGQLSLRAMSLVYTTLLSLVPLLAISFSVLKGFGVHNQIEPFLLEVLAPLGARSDEIAASIVGFVDNTQVGVLGVLGVALLFYTVISLMQKIELAFNDVWQISVQRSFTQRVRDYVTVIVIGPVLVFASIALTAAVMNAETVASLVDAAPLGGLLGFVGRLVPVLMVMTAFTFVYVFVPNTRVRVRAAAVGAVFAGLLWNVTGWVFAGFVSETSRVTVIYSGFATPVLFMIWLYLGWLILLIGANIAFYQQYPEYLRGRRVASSLSELDRQRIGLETLRHIGGAFYAKQTAPTDETLARALAVPEDVVNALLRCFADAGLVVETADDPGGWLPARPWEEASVHDALEILRRWRPQEARHQPAAHLSAGVAAVMDAATRASLERFGATTLKDFCADQL